MCPFPGGPRPRLFGLIVWDGWRRRCHATAAIDGQQTASGLSWAAGGLAGPELLERDSIGGSLQVDPREDDGAKRRRLGHPLDCGVEIASCLAKLRVA